MIDEFERKVIILAECIINPSTVACGYFNRRCFEIRVDFLKDLIKIMDKYNVCFDFYDCPEFLAFGLPRPASSKTFYEKRKKNLRRKS